MEGTLSRQSLLKMSHQSSQGIDGRFRIINEGVSRLCSFVAFTAVSPMIPGQSLKLTISLICYNFDSNTTTPVAVWSKQSNQPTSHRLLFE